MASHSLFPFVDNGYDPADVDSTLTNIDSRMADARQRIEQQRELVAQLQRSISDTRGRLLSIPERNASALAPEVDTLVKDFNTEIRERWHRTVEQAQGIVDAASHTAKERVVEARAQAGHARARAHDEATAWKILPARAPEDHSGEAQIITDGISTYARRDADDAIAPAQHEVSRRREELNAWAAAERSRFRGIVQAHLDQANREARAELDRGRAAVLKARADSYDDQRGAVAAVSEAVSARHEELYVAAMSELERSRFQAAKVRDEAILDAAKLRADTRMRGYTMMYSAQRDAEKVRGQARTYASRVIDKANMYAADARAAADEDARRIRSEARDYAAVTIEAAANTSKWLLTVAFIKADRVTRDAYTRGSERTEEARAYAVSIIDKAVADGSLTMEAKAAIAAQVTSRGDVRARESLDRAVEATTPLVATANTTAIAHHASMTKDLEVLTPDAFQARMVKVHEGEAELATVARAQGAKAGIETESYFTANDIIHEAYDDARATVTKAWEESAKLTQEAVDQAQRILTWCHSIIDEEQSALGPELQLLREKRSDEETYFTILDNLLRSRFAMPAPVRTAKSQAGSENTLSKDPGGQPRITAKAKAISQKA